MNTYSPYWPLKVMRRDPNGQFMQLSEHRQIVGRLIDARETGGRPGLQDENDRLKQLVEDNKTRGASKVRELRAENDRLALVVAGTEDARKTSRRLALALDALQFIDDKCRLFGPADRAREKIRAALDGTPETATASAVDDIIDRAKRGSR